jgi:hypothetical protein
MKLEHKERRFDTTEEIHAESQEIIDTHFITSRDTWNRGKHTGIHVQGDYFEGDGGNYELR